MAKRKRHNERTKERRLAAIDRFAGSSEEEEEEEESHDDDDNEEEEMVPMKKDEQEATSTDATAIERRSEEEKPQDETREDDIADDELLTESSGMANAMARILSGGTSTQPSVVLSKTTTKLQLQNQHEAQNWKDLKIRRKLNREKRLSNYASPIQNETERYHRRVATRGVVALFNAIQQHKQQTTTTTPANTKTKPENSKDEFISLIQKQATKNATPPKQIKWDALSDQFPTKVSKNWDEESSSEEEPEELVLEEEN